MKKAKKPFLKYFRLTDFSVTELQSAKHQEITS